MSASVSQLRRVLDRPGLIIMPCCWDALSARLVERAGFPMSFMSGFAVSAARLALPDTGLISYGEMVDVVGWRIEEVVDRIRGPKETIVRLSILPANQPDSGATICACFSVGFNRIVEAIRSSGLASVEALGGA